MKRNWRTNKEKRKTVLHWIIFLFILLILSIVLPFHSCKENKTNYCKWLWDCNRMSQNWYNIDIMLYIFFPFIFSWLLFLFLIYLQLIVVFHGVLLFPQSFFFHAFWNTYFYFLIYFNKWLYFFPRSNLGVLLWIRGLSCLCLNIIILWRRQKLKP